MNTNMKILTAAVAAHILGKKTNIKLEGSRNRVMVVKDVINASRNLYEAMNHPSASLSNIRLHLLEKSTAAKKFKAEFNQNWPL